MKLKQIKYSNQRSPPRLKIKNKKNGKETEMAFFVSAIALLQSIVMLIGAAVCLWGVINLMEGYGGDNPAANAHVQ